MIGDLDFVVPDLAEPIRAYRQWNVDVHGTLRSSVGWTAWPTDGPLEAVCLIPSTAIGWYMGIPFPTGTGAPCKRVPSPNADAHMGLGCGVYGWSTFDELASRTSFLSTTVVVGEVLLSGRVYVHELGYRAERATVDRLYDTGCDRLAAAAERYGVDVVPVDMVRATTLRLIRAAEIDAARAKAEQARNAAALTGPLLPGPTPGPLPRRGRFTAALDVARGIRAAWKDRR